METLGKFIVGIVLAGLGIIIGGFFFMKLWVWFMIPAFETLPVLTFAQSIGVATFIAMMKVKRETNEKTKDFGDIVGDWFESLIFIIVMYGMAYVIHLCIR
jgi:hypothetical protein